MIAGAHESAAGGLHLALERMSADAGRSLQIFTKNSNSWQEPALATEKIDAFRRAHQAAGRPAVLAHTSYLLNLGTGDADLRERSKAALVAELERSSALGIAFVVLHPGAHLGAGEQVGVSRVGEALAEVLARVKGGSARLLLENTAGQGTSLGCRFEHLAGILEAAGEAGEGVGVCFDTQHAFASGYDLSTDEGYEETFRRFDAIVGLGRLRALHLNDSKKPLGSRVDRHEHIGDGGLGLRTFWHLANDPRFALTPAVLETEPREGGFPYRDELALLASLVGASAPARTAAPLSLELAPAVSRSAPRPRAGAKQASKKSRGTT